MKIRNAQQGHAHLMLFVAVGFALIGFVGFNVYNKSNSADLANATTAAAHGTGGDTYIESSSKPIAKAKKVEEKRTPSMRILQRALWENNIDVGYVELTVPGASLEKRHCSGKVSVRYSASSVVAVYTKELPLKYIKQKQFNNGNGYCAVRLKTDGKITGADVWDVKASFKGNKYLNALPEQSGQINNAKRDVAVRVLSRSSSDPKNVIGLVEVKVPGEDLHRNRCANHKVHALVTNAKTGKKLYERDLSLRYVKQAKLNDGLGYCIAQLPKGSAKTTSGAWTVTGTYKGGNFLNASPIPATTFTN